MLLVLAARADPDIGLLLLAGFMVGFALEQFAVAWETTMQEHVPADKLARVYSYDMLGSFVAMPIGQVAAGPLAERSAAADPGRCAALWPWPPWACCSAATSANSGTRFQRPAVSVFPAVPPPRPRRTRLSSQGENDARRRNPRPGPPAAPAP